MTAGVNYIFKEFFTVVSKRKNRKRKPSPNDGKIRKACKSQALPAVGKQANYFSRSRATL